MSIPITKGNAACKILIYYFLIVNEIHFMGIRIVFLLAPTWYRRFRVFSNEMFNIYIYHNQIKICRLKNAKNLGSRKFSSLGRSAGSFTEEQSHFINVISTVIWLSFSMQGFQNASWRGRLGPS